MSNDYTKNISDSIFSPGIMVEDAPAAATIDAKTRHTLYSGNKHGYRDVIPKTKSTLDAPAKQISKTANRYSRPKSSAVPRRPAGSRHAATTKALLREIEAERAKRASLRDELAAVRIETQNRLDLAKMKLSSENSRV